MATLTATVSAANDATSDGAAFAGFSPSVYLGKYGALSTDVNRPGFYVSDDWSVLKGATINSATIRLTAAIDADPTPVRLKVHVEDVDTASTWSNPSHTPGNATLTTAGTDWDPVAWLAATDYTSPSFAAALQEWADRPGLNGANGVCVVIAEDGAVGVTEIEATAGSAFVSVDYTPAAGGSPGDEGDWMPPRAPLVFDPLVTVWG